MAKEKEKKAKKPNFFKRTGTRIASFFKGIVSGNQKSYMAYPKTGCIQYAVCSGVLSCGRSNYLARGFWIGNP